MTELPKNNFAKFYQASGKLLYTPGPTAVPLRVLQAMSKPIINPDLDPEFPFWFLETSKMMGNIMQTENEVLLLPGEGMLALDAAINSVVQPKDKVLVLASGIFGHGFANMVKNCGAEPIIVATKGYDDIITAAMVEEAIDKHPDIAAITLVHCETPSGTLNPLEKIAKVCKKSDAILIVDAVSSIGGTEVKTDDWGIDINLCASQKCLSSPPGIGVLSLSEKAIEIITARENIPSFYSDLRVWINSWIKNRTMPFTHSISNLYAFRESLDMIMEEGKSNMISRHKTISKAILKAIESINLELFPKKKEFISPTVTALKVPKGIEVDKLIDLLWKKYGVLIAGAWGPVLGGKIIRLGNMGFGANPRFAAIALSALEHGLKDLGYKIDVGTAVLAFEEAL